MKVDKSINKQLQIHIRAKTRESIKGFDVLKWGTKALKLGIPQALFLGFTKMKGIYKLRNKRGKMP